MIGKTFKFLAIAAVSAIFSIGEVKAQSNSDISDEKLTAYIMVMDSINSLTSQVQEDMSAKILEHEQLDGGRAFQTIQSAGGDSAKLEEEGITDEQLAAYNEIQAEMEARKNEVNSTFKTLVKEKVGAADYNKIKNGLRSDAELKKRYDEIAARMEERESAEGEAMNTASPASVN